MKSFLFAAAFMPLSLALNLERRAVCNRDNCLRAVHVSSAPVSSSRVTTDCSSFQRATLYPSAVTTTTTSGSISTTIYPALTNTVIQPSSLPPYASSPCASGGKPTSRFASACSCAGVSATTSTAPVPTVIIVQPFPAVPYQVCSNPFQRPDGSFDGNDCDVVPAGTSRCVCYQTDTVGGPDYCAAPTWPCGESCNSNNDCLSTQFCVVGTYCSTATNGTCVGKTYFDSCDRPGTAARLFKRTESIVGGLPVSPS